MSVIKKQQDEGSLIWKPKYIPIINSQHFEELVVNRPFSFKKFTHRFSVLSSLNISFEPTFSSLLLGKLTVEIKDNRRTSEDPLSNYAKLSFSLTKKVNFVLSDFPTISCATSSPYSVVINVEVTGVKFDEVLGYLKFIPNFRYTNTSKLPKTVSVRLISDSGIENPKVIERSFSTLSQRPEVEKLKI